MKGEFVGKNGRYRAWRVGCIRGEGDGAFFIPFEHPDFPAAVAALTELLPKPSVHPAVGLRYCGEEEAFDWAAGDDRFRYEDGVIKWWTPIARGGDGRKREAPMLHCFNAGREYERRQG